MSETTTRTCPLRSRFRPRSAAASAVLGAAALAAALAASTGTARAAQDPRPAAAAAAAAAPTPPRPVSAAPLAVHGYWPVTFVNTEPPAPGQAESAASRGEEFMNSLATGLDGLFPQADPAKPVRRVSAIGNTLIFHTPEAAETCRRLLALYVDVPWPQVRVDLFSIQSNTRKPADAADALDTLELGAEMTRDLIAHFNTDVHAFVRDRAQGQATERWRAALTPANANGSDDLTAYLDGIQHRALSGPEAILLLPFVSQGQGAKFTGDHAKRIAGRLGEYRRLLQGLEASEAKSGAGKRTAAERKRDARLLELLERIQRNVDNTTSGTPLPAIYAGFSSGAGGGPGVEVTAARDLLYAFRAVESGGADGRPNGGPEQFIAAQSVMDGLIRTMVERYDADIQRLFFRPLRDWMAQVVRESPSAGLNISSVVRLTVTARRPASLDTQATGFTPFTPPGATLTADQTVAAFTRLDQLPGILAAVKTDPTYTSVAPGVQLGIRPTVLPDGGNARLPIRLTSSVQVNNPTEAGAVPAGGPLDHVQSASTVTDLHVRAFDLFHLSTTSMEHTSLGDYRWRVPVLENLPLFGPMFRGPRGPVTKRQSVMVVGNVMVLPRSIDLLRYVRSRNFDVAPGRKQGERAAAVAAPAAKPGEGERQ